MPLFQKKLIAVCAGFLILQTTSSGEIPALFQETSFSPATLARAVNHYVELGERAAVKELVALASDSVDLSKRNFSITHRVSWVCRILFEPRGKSPLRPASLGGYPDLPWEAMPLEKWPLFPLVRSGKSYFILSEMTVGSGVPESPSQYLAYCQKAGLFRQIKIPVPSEDQAKADAAKLLISPAWVAIATQKDNKGKNRDHSIGLWMSLERQVGTIPLPKAGE